MSSRRTERDEPDEKSGAIFELRRAAEEHGRAEERLLQDPSTEKIGDLIEARTALDEKTEAAVQACKKCGQPHAPTASQCVTGTDGRNVINVNFARTGD